MPESDLPTHEQIRKMADELREMHKSRGLEPDVNAIVAALIHGDLTPPLLVREALKTHWPEAAKSIYLDELDTWRSMFFMSGAYNYRPRVIYRCEALVREWAERDECEACPYGKEEAAWLLDEWDAIHFPRQVPEPRRVAALARLRRAGITLETLTRCN